jgi:Tfp pilus assembly protein PilO
VENKKMSLKYLFFPIILIVAAVTFWLFVWPAIMSLQTITAEYKVSQQELLAVQERKTALETLNAQLKSGDKNGALAASYLPVQKAEEKIIGQINYLASNSEIFLNNLEIIKAPESTTVAASPAPINMGVAGIEPMAVAPVVSNIQTVVSVEGDYDKLKAFFNGVQRMPLFNSIKTLDIVSTEKIQTDPAVKKVEYVITAKLAIDFGYLGRLQADNNNLKNIEPIIDSKTLDGLDAYTTKTIPEINTNNMVVGSSNPFLP